jgi:Ni/Co efflux regulator RcnB
MKKIVLIAAMVFLASTGLVQAQRATKSTSGRQVSQQARIGEGVRSKELTRHETVRLEREQRRIQLEKKAAKADGTVTPREKRFLRREQNRANRHIHRQKNDRQVRG